MSVCIQERTAAVSQTCAVEVCVIGAEEGVLLQKLHLNPFIERPPFWTVPQCPILDQLP